MAPKQARGDKMDKRADIWLQDNKLLFPEAGDEPKKCGSPVASLRSKIKSLRIDKYRFRVIGPPNIAATASPVLPPPSS